MNRDPMTRIEQIRQREQQATEGPWRVDYQVSVHRRGSPSCRDICGGGRTPDRVYQETPEQAAAQGFSDTEMHEFWPRQHVKDVLSVSGEHVYCGGHDYDEVGFLGVADAEFIAHAREDIPHLLTLWDTRDAALRTLVEQLRARSATRKVAADDTMDPVEYATLMGASHAETLMADALDAILKETTP